jgi:hypothetical protein
MFAPQGANKRAEQLASVSPWERRKMEALILSSLPDGLVVWERGDKRKAQEIKAKTASKVSLRREPHRPPRRGEGRRRYCRLSEATHAWKKCAFGVQIPLGDFALAVVFIP